MEVCFLMTVFGLNLIIGCAGIDVCVTNVLIHSCHKENTRVTALKTKLFNDVSGNNRPLL
jgi:hypothetical protein